VSRKGSILFRIAGASVLAVLFLSCSGKLRQAESLDLSQTPIQTLDHMFAVQSKNGYVSMRLEAPLMERYDNDTMTYESFPKGLSLYGYTEEGLLETIIVADNARHVIKKGRHRNKEEIWEAYGNVIVHNVLKEETMETDTLFWDQSKEEIYTDCYVQMYSPDGYMQGIGMRSDDHARNAILHNPFNSYGIMDRDTTAVRIDSVNFIGPLLRKR